MLASRKTARKAAECGNGLINSVDSSGLAVTVSRKDPRLDCSDSMPSAFRTRAGSSPKRVINSAARLSASSSRAASRSTGSTEDPPRARARTWARSSARCAPGVYASYIRSPVPSPVGLGWTATHWVHGAFAHTRPPGVNLLLVVSWRRSSAGSLEFPCPPSHHGSRFVRQSSHRRCCDLSPESPGPSRRPRYCRPLPESFSLEDPHRAGSHDPIFRSGHVGHPAGLDAFGHGLGPDRLEETDLRSRLHHEGYRWQGCSAREVPGQGVADRQYRQPVRLYSPIQGATGDLSEVQGSRIRGPRLPGQRVRRPGAWNG